MDDPPLLFGDRANALEPTLNAISTETFESALSKAETPALGLFSGVPTFIKGLVYGKRVVNDLGSWPPSGLAGAPNSVGAA